MFQKGFKVLGFSIVPILIFTQTAVAAPLSIIYQTKTSQNVQVDYINALANPQMKNALTSALLAEEVANLPIFITDDNGSTINYTAALGRNENYVTALNDPVVNRATAPVATHQMNTDGSVTSVEPSNLFTYNTSEDLLGNTIVNVIVSASNVTGVKVKGTAATQVGTSNVWRVGLTGSVIVASSEITLTTGNTETTNVPATVQANPSSVNSVQGGSQSITLTAQDTYGNPMANQTIYLQTGIKGLWITQVNGTTIAGSVNMGTSSATSMRTITTPVPLFNLGIGASAPAYQSASAEGLTAYHLNDNTTPVVALTTGVDGTVSITLVDGNVTYVANTASATATNSYTVDLGTAISNKALTISSDLAGTQKLGSVLVNWSGSASNALGALGVSHTALLSDYSSLNAVPQAASFSNVVGSDEQIYVAAYNQEGKIIAPASATQFDGYALTYDITTPSGVFIDTLGATALPTDPTHGGVSEIKAHYTQNGGFVVDNMKYTDGILVPSASIPAIFGAYDGSGQLNFYLNSNNTSSVIANGTTGSVKVAIGAYSNSATTIDTIHAQGFAAGTINATFTAGNAIGSLGVAADPSGFSTYYPLLEGQAAPGSTLTVAGIASPEANGYNSMSNASFVVAPFNTYPAIGTIPSQGLTMNISSSHNGVISNVDGYTIASLPDNTTVNVNSLGEVKVNNLKLWTAQSGYKVVGYLPGSTSASVTLIEENLSTPTSFIGVNVPSIGSAGSQVASWSLPLTSLPGSSEGFLGFNVNATGQLQPMAASYFAKNGNSFAPYSTNVSTLAACVFTPVEVAHVYVSDKYPESSAITVSNSLNSQTATVTANFSAVTAETGILETVQANPSSVNAVMGGSQNITMTVQDVYGNPIANQTIYLGTGIPGLWITQVNGTTITGSVNMGTTSTPSMKTVNTPIPLFSVVNTPAYSSASVAGLTAYNLQTASVVALTTGVDGTVSITLVDGNVTYVANTASATATNSYAVDPGTAISNKALTLYTDNAETKKLGSVQVNWK